MKKKPGFRKVIAKAASTWTSLGVAGTALVAAAAIGSWPILAIGGAAYAALVGWDLANPDFWKKALGGVGPEGARLPDPDKLDDKELAACVKCILGARAEMARVLAETPDEIQVNLAAAIAQVAELERHAAALVLRAADLGKYLRTVNTAAIKAELAGIEARLAKSRDDVARRSYEEVRRVRVEQLTAISDIDAARDRVNAQLATIVAALEGLPPKIVRMRALDAQAMDEISGSVKDELARMNGEVRVFEETLRSLAEVAGT